MGFVHVTEYTCTEECSHTDLLFFLSDILFHSLLQHLHIALCPCNCGKKQWLTERTSQKYQKGGAGTSFLDGYELRKICALGFRKSNR